MNTLVSLTPAILGLLIVLQTGLNRRIGAAWGLPAATVLNAVVLLSGALVVLAVSVYRPAWIAPAFGSHIDPKLARVWFVVPGLLGLTLLLFAPWAMARWGAVHTFVLIVSGQLVGSLLWDWKVEGLPVSKERLLGIALAWAGVFLATRGR